MAFFKRAAARLGRKYTSMSIQMVISLSFTLVAVLGTVAMGISLFWRFSSDTQRLQADSSQRVLAQVNLNFDSYLRRMMRISDTLYYRVIKETDLAEDGVDAAMRLLYEENRDHLVSMALFDSDGGLVAAVPYDTLKTSIAPAAEPWFISAYEKPENLHFFTPHVQNLLQNPDNPYRWVVSLSRYVELTYGGGTAGGVLLVDMNFRGIEQICRNVQLDNDGYVYLIDGSGELIYHPKQQLIYAGLYQENNTAAAAYRDGSYSEEFGGGTRQVTVKTVGYTGWKLVGVVPAENLLFTSEQFILFAACVILFFALLMTFINLRISAHIADPIRQLDQAVKQLEAGVEEVEFPEEGGYEVQRLSHSVRSMVSTMRHLMQDIIQQESEKRHTELEVLQSQINPHFLYNSLDSVIWMIESGRYDEAVQMVTSLARLFRISLSKGSRIIPLADEIQHASHYMIIQQMRFKNKFTAQFDVAENVANLYTLKLSIQPILENAIYHGMASADGDGEIIVHVYRTDCELCIDVADNGLGMPPAVVQRLLQPGAPTSGSKSGSGIGLRNVHSRIQLAFGKQYGLFIRSEPDEGTTVQIRMPLLTQAEAMQKEGQNNAKEI